MSVTLTGGTEWHSSNRYVSLYIFIYLILLAIVFTLSKCLHDRPRLAAVLPEAAMIILVGMSFGLAHYISDLDFNAHEEQTSDEVVHSVLAFSPVTFFVVLLPPVIFNGGYHMRRDLFFRYITPICLYACVGTAVCAVAVATILYYLKGLFGFDVTFLELMAFGALISATDPVSTLSVFSAKKVDPHLFYLVFGESVINDAVGLVLFEALAHLIHQSAAEDEEFSVSTEVLQFLLDFVGGFIGSLCLGTVFGLVVAYFLKKVDMRATPMLELCLYATIIYFPFVLAELFHLSGIVSVLFTAISAQRYAKPNLSETTAQNSDTLFRLASHLAETIIFLELGMSFMGLIGVGAFPFAFVGLSLLACLVGRAVNIYPSTFVYNLCVVLNEKKPKESDSSTVVTTSQTDEEGQTNPPVTPIDDTLISLPKANMLWWSGLRGAVSYGLVRTFPATENKDIFVVTTVVIVIVTTFVFGGSTAWALDHHGIPVDVDEVDYLRSVRKKRLLYGCMRRFERNKLQTWVIRDSDTTRKSSSSGADDEKKPVDETSDTIIDTTERATDYHEHGEMVEREKSEGIVGSDSVLTTGVYDFGQ